MAALAETAAKTDVAPKLESAPKADPRRRVLDAAIACFTRNGFHGTSMHEICAQAQMSPGALYRYFPSKDAIIIAIVEEERALRASLMAHLEGAPSFVDALTAMGTQLFTGEMEMVCAELGPEIAAEATRNPRLKATFDEVEAEMNQSMRRAFLAAQARGEIDTGIDADAALILINAVGDGLMLRNRLSPELPLGTMMPALGDLIRRMLAPQTSHAADPVP